MDVLLAIGSLVVSIAPNLVGFILPPFVELLNKDVKNDNERYIVSILTCLLVSAILRWNELTTTPQNIFVYAGIIFIESNTLFKLYFDNSWVRQSIQQKIGSTKQVGVDETATE